MRVEHGSHACEHCGAKVPAALICPCCSNEHSAVWIATAKKSDEVQGLAALFAMPYLAFQFYTLWDLPLKQFLDGVGHALLNSIIIVVVVFIVHMMIFGAKPTAKEIETAGK